MSILRSFFSQRGVGHFRSSGGRTAYIDAYRRAMSLVPAPTATYDVATDFGTVRAYEWSAPRVTETVPFVLVPGWASGVPMWSANLPGFVENHRVVAGALDAAGPR